jgi:hypothetical protein
MAEVDALAEVPVGPDLATALAGADGDRLPGPGLVGLMEARHRQANHERGELLAAVGRILLHDVPGGARMWKGPDGVAVDQVRADQADGLLFILARSCGSGISRYMRARQVSRRHSDGRAASSTTTRSWRRPR